MIALAIFLLLPLPLPLLPLLSFEMRDLAAVAVESSGSGKQRAVATRAAQWHCAFVDEDIVKRVFAHYADSLGGVWKGTSEFLQRGGD